jgi:hypothetical protein
MKRPDITFKEVLVDGQTVTLPTESAWQNIVTNPIFLGAPVYFAGTKNLVTNLILFVSGHRDNFRLGMFRSKGMKSWIVLPLLLMEGRLQRVHIEHVACNKCGRRVTIANPSEPSLYFGIPDELAATRAASKLPRVDCPNCGATLARFAAWAELSEAGETDA